MSPGVPETGTASGIEGMVDAGFLGRLSRQQLVRLVATCDHSLAHLRNVSGVADASAERLDLEELGRLPQDRLRGLLLAQLTGIVQFVLSTTAAKGSQANWEALFEAVRRGSQGLGFSYRQVIFELMTLLPFWQGGVTRSGLGSTLEATVALRAALPPLLARHEIRTLLDAPCGDFHWACHVDWGAIRYIGVDIVADLVEGNREQYACPQFTFELCDIVRDELPEADAILCRDCLIHFCIEDVLETVTNFKRSGARLLLTTTFPSLVANARIVTGHYRPINLQIAPYDFPEPLELIAETPRKFLGVWRMEDLPGF